MRIVTGLVLSVLVAGSFLAVASATEFYDDEIAITELQVKDVQGQELVECTGCASSMLMLTAEMKNYLSTPEPFVIYLEVRDLTTGFTMYNELGIGTLSPGGSTEVAISWKPGQPGNYELRSFVIDDLQNTERMSKVATIPLVIS